MTVLSSEVPSRFLPIYRPKARNEFAAGEGVLTGAAVRALPDPLALTPTRSSGQARQQISGP